MHDPRKPVFRPDPDRQAEVRELARLYLMAATSQGSKALNCSGASFVLVGLGVYASEMAEVDSRATATMLRCLGDLYDPDLSPAKKDRAERRRKDAVNQLLAAVDLHMAQTGGQA